MMFVVIAAIGFYLFTTMQKARQAQPNIDDRPSSRIPGEQADHQGPYGDSVYQKPEQSRPELHPDRSDWDMEEVPTGRRAESNAVELDLGDPDGKDRKGKRTDKGDWSMEEVYDEDEIALPGEAGFKASNSVEKKPKTKSTRKGDWELEEVDNDGG